MTRRPVARMGELPDALAALPDIVRQMAGRRLALFLDLDGTLAPIAARPDLVEVPAATRELLERLAPLCPVTVVSGRGLDDLRDKVQVRSLYYAADHGFQILGPVRSRLELEVGREYRPQLELAAAALQRALQTVEGALVEEKGLSLAVHYRLVPESRQGAVLRAVADVAERFPVLRVTEGKLVYEFRPPDAWNKGKAVLWILQQLGLGRGGSRAQGGISGTEPLEGFPIAIGDDLTDEDMFAAVEGWGAGVIVGDPGRPTRAAYQVSDHLEAARLLEAILGILSEH
jgi:trehalose 6-phosphate phosphatase